MKCLTPIFIKYPEKIVMERKAFLEENHISMTRHARDKFLYGFDAPCGKCAACKQKRKSEWLARLIMEFKNSDSAFFITLTYDDEHIPVEKNEKTGEMYHPVSKRDIQLFMKRLRKSLPYPIRFYLISEYGPSYLRPHYHGIIFNLDLNHVSKISESWRNGFVRVDPVTHGRIAYCTSYCFDDMELPYGYQKNFMLCSRRPAIGGLQCFTPALIDFIRTDGTYTLPLSSGNITYKYSLPCYHRNKIFSRDELLARATDLVEQAVSKDDDLDKEFISWCRKHNRRVDYYTESYWFDDKPSFYSRPYMSLYPGSPALKRELDKQDYAERKYRKSKMNKKKNL